MANGSIKHTGDGFVVLKKGRKSRKGVLMHARRLMGGGNSVNHTLVYTDPAHLGEYLAFRISVSLQLARLAFYYSYLLTDGQSTFYVGGAEAQIGRGNAGTPTRNAAGNTEYNGSDAAHTRLGSFSVDNRPVCLAWPEALFALAEAAGISKSEIEERMPANARLAAAAAVLDARTDLTDAMFNRVFGKIEDYCHAIMRANLVPVGRIADAAGLRSAVMTLNSRCAPALVKAMKTFCKRRLREIQSDSSVEQFQQAVNQHGQNAMFVSEGDMLRAMVAEFDNESGPMWRQLQRGEMNSETNTLDELEMVEAAKQELVSIRS